MFTGDVVQQVDIRECFIRHLGCCLMIVRRSSVRTVIKKNEEGRVICRIKSSMVQAMPFFFYSLIYFTVATDLTLVNSIFGETFNEHRTKGFTLILYTQLFTGDNQLFTLCCWRS